MSDSHARSLLVVLVVAAALLTALLARPFWEALFLAAVLAAALLRPMEWLTARVGGRRSVAAAILTVGLIVAVLLPLGTLGAVLVGEIVSGVQWLRDVLQSEGVNGLVTRLPPLLQHGVQALLRLIPEPQAAFRSLAGQGGTAAAALGGFLAATGGILFQAAMMLIAFFFFLTDGHRLVAWIDASVPLRPGQVRTLLADFRQTSVSVLLATVGTAAIQSVVALAGYLIARAPNPLFLVLVTFVLALVPAAGATIVVIAIGLLLVATGHLFAGGFLVAWGAAVVSLSDNLARPVLLKGGMELHGGLVFFSLLGALAVFGGIGLVVGPLVLTFLVAVVKLYRREFLGAGDGVEPPEDRPPLAP